jgi:phosphonopyruvate decarboxylase
MISSGAFCEALAEHGTEFVSGVPCSYFGGPIVRLTESGVYRPAVNEGAALAMATGARLAGVGSAVIAQNSGLGNLINPLTSLNLPYRLPALLFVSLRGWPDPNSDEPQHSVMGPSSHAILDSIGVRHWTVAPDATDLAPLLDEAAAEIDAGRVAAILVPKGAVAPAPPTAPAADSLPSRAEVLAHLVKPMRGGAVVSTTGYTSRELFSIADRPGHFYMQGSMGHASALALGVALQAPGRRVFLLDGDGALLMHLGTLITIGAAGPIDLVHIVFDNGSYESTGGQPTGVGRPDFAGMALAAGYPTATHCRGLTEIADGLARTAGVPGPHLLQVPVVSSGGSAPPRATAAISAPELAARFARELGTDR